jgi:tetratricopeptide (TPR) repeat protein
VNDIFEIQKEVAKNIAGRIKAIITPEEEEQINKIPTDNLEAYEYFLKGQECLFKATREGLIEALPYFENAIKLDVEFAQAYADVAICYYYLDIMQTTKQYIDEINYNADKALLYDSKSPQSLVAKALYYMVIAEYAKAVPYLEKALEFNPNSAWVINFLSDFYTNYITNTEKYLEYSLKGIKLNPAEQDSITASFTYLHVSNAFVQTGFLNEAEHYINISLKYNPDNLYSQYVKAYILYAIKQDLETTKEQLISVLSKDSTRLDILQEVAKVCYYLRDYETSYYYYKKFINIKEAYGLDIYKAENAKIGVVLSKIGLSEKSDLYFEKFKSYVDTDKSIYKNLSTSMYYAYKGYDDKAIEYLKLFSQENNYHYWTILFLKDDPLIEKVKNNMEFQKLLKEIETKFWANHNRIKSTLEDKGLL